MLILFLVAEGVQLDVGQDLLPTSRYGITVMETDEIHQSSVTFLFQRVVTLLGYGEGMRGEGGVALFQRTPA